MEDVRASNLGAILECLKVTFLAGAGDVSFLPFPTSRRCYDSFLGSSVPHGLAS